MLFTKVDKSQKPLIRLVETFWQLLCNIGATPDGLIMLAHTPENPLCVGTEVSDVDVFGGFLGLEE